ncbi:MAG: flagellar protein FlgN [Actinobacteria bacterium]|nr:flagellar protein FlgN [Actinomycetota bacterium]
MTRLGADMDGVVRDYTELANQLWREREVLTHVLFKLEVERVIVASGQTRWLAPANRELDAALGQLRATEVLRAMESDALAERLGQPATASLSELIAVADEPWSTILTEHRDALRQLTAEVQASAESNRRLLDAALGAVRETLASISASIGTDNSDGQA